MQFLNRLSWISNLSILLWFFCKLHIFLLWDLCQVCLRPSQENVIYSIAQLFWHVMPQFFDTNATSNIAFWYVMISELGNFFTWIKSQHTLRFPIFINVSFIVLYTLSGIYFPFIYIIGFKPPCSHNFCLLSIKNCFLVSILLFPDSTFS